MAGDKIKCRWCDYSTPLWTTHKGNGAKQTGYRYLVTHIQDRHADKYELLNKIMGDEWAANVVYANQK